jgi:hypothetical protein
LAWILLPSEECIDTVTESARAKPRQTSSMPRKQKEDKEISIMYERYIRASVQQGRAIVPDLASIVAIT